ncbi:hypothetical protein H5410_036652 [Solanum commersonii]|uniref:AP2/ERF domain-containing protein n=1 Tax=Solanum commersonii TaxID=4109 RepID=A0A9J5Y815_SOLCO|nr:hypothetical protein H5410_036652 [Solanum commersonii]
MSSKENKDTKLLQENIEKYMGVRLCKRGKWVEEILDGRKIVQCLLGCFDTVVEVALAYDKEAIEIRNANALKNILEPRVKEIHPINTLPPLRKTKGKSILF